VLEGTGFGTEGDGEILLLEGEVGGEAFKGLVSTREGGASSSEGRGELVLLGLRDEGLNGSHLEPVWEVVEGV